MLSIKKQRSRDLKRDVTRQSSASQMLIYMLSVSGQDGVIDTRLCHLFSPEIIKK
jgi:hypothetical protein